MKTIKILFYSAVLLLGVSCVKEENQPVSPVAGNNDVPYFTALGSPVESKVSLMENGTSVNWTVGDLVAVADGSGDIYKFASEGDGTNAIFRYQSEGEQECMFNKSADKYLMAYPWTSSVAMDMENSTVTSSLPAVQNAVKGNFEGSYAVAVAVGNDIETPFAFKCAVSMLKVEIPETLKGKIAELAVRGNLGEDLVGDLVITCTEEGPVTALGTQKYSEVRLIPEVGSLEPGTYYIAIAPVTVSKGISVVAVSSDNFTEFEISTAKEEKTFMPGYIYNLGALNAEKIEFPVGLGRLPYVFPLFATAGTGNTPKYVTKKVVTVNKEMQLTDASTGAVFTAKTTGGGVDYWSNKWYGQDNVYGLYFTNQDTYYMLGVPLKMSLPSAFKVSFGFFVDGTKNDIIKDWKVQYSKDKLTWYDGAAFELPRILKYHSVEITSEVAFNADDVLHLRWIPTGNTGWDGETNGQNGQIHFSSGVVISEVTGPDSNASGNVYAEDFDQLCDGVDYRHAGQANGIEKLGLLGEVFGAKINNWTEDQKNGMSGSNVAERPGYAQIGFATYANDNRNGAGTNQVGSLVTPALENASGTINLSFKAMCYRSPFTGRAAMSAAAQSDVTDIVVKIKGAGSFTPTSNVTTKTLSGISTDKFDVQTLTIYNTNATTQIEFTSTAVDKKFTRWFIDDICVTK